MEGEKKKSIFDFRPVGAAAVSDKASSSCSSTPEPSSSSGSNSNGGDSSETSSPETSSPERPSIFSPRAHLGKVPGEMCEEMKENVQNILRNITPPRPMRPEIEWSYPEEEFDDFTFNFDLCRYQRSKIKFTQIYKNADELREAGNRKFKFDKYAEAIARYEKANIILDDTKMTNNKDEAKARGYLQYKLYSNISLCYLRMNDAESALAACKAALGPDMPEPPNGKVYFRSATACHLLGKVQEAKKYIKLSLMFNPEDIALRNLEERILKFAIEDSLRSEELYTKMCAHYK